ncbi:hypothetical protein [Halomarina oriensis]|uniref:Uncharacterized protein n=1 Tax=Halomarina oriensis TaxID=671145 RepID=A0A6B0GHP8_9EURY|nr:hypothetical protein [Halomarina oriensis]MWG34254.1 hypothetical protein [Halomarina oriensis]
MADDRYGVPGRLAVVLVVTQVTWFAVGTGMLVVVFLPSGWIVLDSYRVALLPAMLVAYGVVFPRSRLLRR